MLSLFRLEHLGQDYVLIYLIKIPPAAPTKGHLSRHKCAPLDIFFLLIQKIISAIGRRGVMDVGAAASVESIGLSEHRRVCCPP